MNFIILIFYNMMGLQNLWCGNITGHLFNFLNKRNLKHSKTVKVKTPRFTLS